MFADLNMEWQEQWLCLRNSLNDEERVICDILTGDHELFNRRFDIVSYKNIAKFLKTERHKVKKSVKMIRYHCVAMGITM